MMFVRMQQEQQKLDKKIDELKRKNARLIERRLRIDMDYSVYMGKSYTSLQDERYELDQKIDKQTSELVKLIDRRRQISGGSHIDRSGVPKLVGNKSVWDSID